VALEMPMVAEDGEVAGFQQQKGLFGRPGE
jgi:hypothetical protein